MSQTDSLVWRDGELIPFHQATIHVLSHAAHRGSQVFDVLRVVPTEAGPAALGLRAHVARFDRSMQLMGMTSPYDLATLEAAVAATVAANPGANVVKLVAAWAEVALSTRPASRRPQIVVTAESVGGHETVLRDPARLTVATMPKIPAAILPPSLKVAAAYTAPLRHQLDAFDDGFDDVVFRSTEGRLAEAATQSLLVVTGDRILAPMFDTVLDGITRRLVLDVAPTVGLAPEIRDVHWDEVTGADEVVLTSTNQIIRPVASIDDHTYQAPGPLSRDLATEVSTVLAGAHPLSSRWLTPLD